MEYQKIANLLNDGSSKPSKFKATNWVEIMIIVMHIYLVKEI